jgi:5-formyltetrahydrofolate cyclo-ligase
MDFDPHKETIRNEMRRELRAMSAQSRADESHRVCDAVLASDIYKSATSVMGYLPLADEVDITPILEDCLSTGKLLSAPAIDWENRQLSPVQIHDLQKDVRIGKHSVPEPTGTVPIAPASLDLLLIPALAFDTNCSRLGRGAGFYDRFLKPISHQKRPFLLGIAFEMQIVKQIPTAPHDQPVGAVATPTRWIPAGQKPDFQSDQE